MLLITDPPGGALPRSRPGCWPIAIVVGAHILLLFAWPKRELTTATTAARSSGLVFVIEARKSAPSQALRKPLPDAAVRPRPVVGPRQPSPVAVEPPEAISAPPDTLPEQEIPAVTAAVIVERALRDAGKIDRELRKSSLNAAERKLTFGKTRRALAMSSALGGGEGIRIDELVTPDGRRMSKVSSRWGSYCAQMESNGLVGARDVFRDGVKTKISSCP